MIPRHRRVRLLVSGVALLATLLSTAVPSAAQDEPPPACNTTIVVDTPSPGAAVSNALHVRGWALDLAQRDSSGVSQVNLYVDGQPGTGRLMGRAALGHFRPDVDAVFGRPSSQPGWSFAWSTDGTPPGFHTLYVEAQDSCGSSSVALPVFVSPSILTLDRPAADAAVTEGQPLPIGGWAVDPAAASGSGIDAVHVYLDGEAGAGAAIGAATVGQLRTDVAAALGRPAATSSGFSLERRIAGLRPGLHTLYVYAHAAQGWSYRTLPFTLAETPAPRAPVPPGRVFPGGSSGFSISWPQCGEPVPAPPYQVAVVGATGGRAFYQNPCLASQFAWTRAASVAPGLYLNLNAPAGRTAARGLTGPMGTCASEDLACQSFNYGHNAGLHAVAYARSQGAAAPFWWLDVETENTWSENRPLNARVIQGAIEALRAQNLGVGIYSTRFQWNEIAGSFSPGLPVWVAGARNRAEAPSFCGPNAAFGGGPVTLVQYPNGLFSGEYAC